MMSWTQQVQYFFSTLLLGLILGMFFHFYWLLLRASRPGKKLLTLTDILFCLFLLLLVSGALLFINAGDLRLYVWLALFLGGFLYKQGLAKRLTPFLNTLSRGSLAVCGFLIRVIYRPLRVLARTLHRLWKKLWIKGKTSEENPPEEE